ncbi:MAG: AraC family transcriptional regulator [Hespellia sp.]|nr:AraC family transcriptional regulator [Hespellia sp.]
MMHVQVDIMADASEIIHYDAPDIPLYIRKGMLSLYPEKRAVCHWHDDLEIILILSGEMNYYVNGQTVLLQTDEALLVNSREMHYGFSSLEHNCEFICILFHPSLLSGNDKLYQQKISPFLSASDTACLKFTPKQHTAILAKISEIWRKKEAHEALYELDVIGLIYSFMASVVRMCDPAIFTNTQSLSNDVVALRQMVSFIREHYQESLSLQNIADSANICRSKCCSVFQTQIQQSPFDFLNHYRLQKSADLLRNTSLPVTAIALDCGFNHSSYFSKLFHRLYHCTPSEFRNASYMP